MKSYQAKIKKLSRLGEATFIDFKLINFTAIRLLCDNLR